MWIVYENWQPLTMVMIIKEGDVSNGFKKSFTRKYRSLI
ncbi:hypothetical protein IGJ55_002388 [Enterococcus sp. AZ170]|nr:hypothetical protein [Enterococcus ureilyticus]